MLKHLLTGTATLAALCAAAPAQQVFAPTVVASIHDEPVDGLGDTFNNTPFEGLIRVQSTREDRAIQEYDLSSLAGQSLASATLSGRVAVNNAFDNGVRTFDFLLYGANGTADLSDFQIAATVVGSGQYHPPVDTQFTFQFDVTSQLQTLLTGGSNFIGLRVQGTSTPNFPNILVTLDCHLDVVVGTPPVLSFCTPGVSGVLPCPCANPPSGANRGCDNSSATGGASISGSGIPSLAADTLLLTTADQRPSGTSILLQGTTNLGAGLAFGQGVRCNGGLLKRLYVKTAVGGSISAPVGADATISARSAALGDPILAGQHRYYSVYYRDPSVLGGCNALATFNATNAVDVSWN